MKLNYIVLRNAGAHMRGRSLVETLAALRQGLGGSFVKSFSSKNRPSSIRVEVDALTQQEAEDEVQRSGDPHFPVMPVTLVDALEAEPGPRWGLNAVRALESPYDGEGVKVAVLDTGLARNHPAFAGCDPVEKDFTGSGDGDAHGHGTHCAGILFGRDVDGERIGVARGVKKPLIGKIINNDGRGDSIAIVNAVLWAQAEGAQVISMSIGLDFDGYVRQVMQELGMTQSTASLFALEAYRLNLDLFRLVFGLVDVLNRLEGRGGTLIVAAAGNESHSDVNPAHRVGRALPAAIDSVLSVGAVQRDDRGLVVANFSNTSPHLCAPGVGILSADARRGLGYRTGTSMAAPHVAGAAALWWHALRKEPGRADASRVRAKLEATARTDLMAAGYDPRDLGAGVVTAPMT